VKLNFKQTCGACPEQYDVYDDKNNLVGYLRLRHGVFTVNYPWVGGETILREFPDGDGCFEDYEREKYMAMAEAKIIERLNVCMSAPRLKDPRLS
jgi:hypothetical protein